jgi:ABC-type nickel/cobalt efflux system permease component RcnA
MSFGIQTQHQHQLQVSQTKPVSISVTTKDTHYHLYCTNCTPDNPCDEHKNETTEDVVSIPAVSEGMVSCSANGMCVVVDPTSPDCF